MQYDAFIRLWSTCSYRLYTFLSMRDVAHLDSAFTNGLIRKEFHACLSRSSFVGLLFHSKNKKWIMSKNLAPEKLLFEHNISDCDVIALTESCRAVEKMSVGSTFQSLSSTALVKLLANSPKLISFELTRYHNPHPLVYETLAKKCKNLTELSLQTVGITASMMQVVFSSCHDLKTINLVDLLYPLDDSVVASIAEYCSNLTSLSLTRMERVRAESVERLGARCTRLTTLRLTHCPAVLRGGLYELARNCRMLTTLDLQKSHLGFAIVAAFACNNTQLTDLGLAFCAGVSDSALCTVARHCKQLERIDLTFNNRVTDLSAAELVTSCNNLKYLEFTFAPHLTDATVNAIAAHCHQLEKLNLSHCYAVTPAALCKVAARCTKLVSLDVSVESTNDALFQKLARNCPNFVKLSLHDVQTQPNPAALHSVSNYLCRLQTFCCATLGSTPDAAVLQLVENCPHLRTLVVVRLLMVCQDKRIVKAIARNCPHITYLHLGRCSDQVARAVYKWQQSGNAKGIVEIVYSGEAGSLV